MNIGANPSTEGGEDEDGQKAEEVDDAAQNVNDVVDAFRLEETVFDKKGYMTYLKGYIKTIRSKLEAADPSKVAAFEAAAQCICQKDILEFRQLSLLPRRVNGSRSHGVPARVPGQHDEIMIYWKDGLKTQKF